jgi:hypothetical protein
MGDGTLSSVQKLYEAKQTRTKLLNLERGAQPSVEKYEYCRDDDDHRKGQTIPVYSSAIHLKFKVDTDIKNLEAAVQKFPQYANVPIDDLMKELKKQQSIDANPLTNDHLRAAAQFLYTLGAGILGGAFYMLQETFKSIFRLADQPSATPRQFG